MTDVVVVGAGLAGLLAAARLQEQGAQVTVVTFGVGGLQLSHGGFDVLGYAPDYVERPFDALDGFAAEHPDHPYALLGADQVRAGAEYAERFFGSARLGGNGTRNWRLPTAVGALRPTWLAPQSMTEADPGTPQADAGGRDRDGREVVVIGLRQLKDFPAELIAGNLARQPDYPAVRASVVDFPARGPEPDSSAVAYARSLDDPAYRSRFAKLLRRTVRRHERVLLPAIVGLRDPDAFGELQELVGAPLAEVPLPPPGVPGMRLTEFATRTLQDRRVRWILGSRVVGVHGHDQMVQSVDVATSGHTTTLTTGAVVYAPGGFESGALQLDSHGVVSEAHLGLPVRVPDGELVVADRHAEQPLFRAGLAVDDRMRVLDAAGRPVYRNLYAAGGVLAGALRWTEKSGEGIAAASAVRAADVIGGQQ